MINIQSITVRKENINEIINEVKSKLPSNPNLILFFASTTFDFEKISILLNQEYPNSEVLGLTTTGEIEKEGLTTNSLVIQSFEGEDFKVKGILMNNIEKYPIFSRNDILNAAKNLGLDLNSTHNNSQGLCLVFPNGLIASEEKMLSIINSVFEHEGFPIFGGTAGDDAKFKKTLVSYNGKVSSKGGLACFIKTSESFHITKENIFKTTGKKMKITKSDPELRIVSEINNKRASSEYARLLGVNEKKLSDYFMSNPIGRKINNEIYIASPFQVLDNGSIQFYCQIFQGAEVEILEPKDPLKTVQDTIDNFNSHFHSIDGVIAINCILRKLQFESQNIVSKVNKELKKLPNLAGFSSYGEQLNKSQLNQTMILLGFGKVKNEWRKKQ